MAAATLLAAVGPWITRLSRRLDPDDAADGQAVVVGAVWEQIATLDLSGAWVRRRIMNRAQVYATRAVAKARQPNVLLPGEPTGAAAMGRVEDRDELIRLLRRAGTSPTDVALLVATIGEDRPVPGTGREWERLRRRRLRSLQRLAQVAA